MSVQFGSSSCSSITVAEFTPICSFTEPAGTTPLTFDVPVPHFAMPVPPNECQCFDFDTGDDEADVTVVPSCGTGKASCSVQIVKKDTDCCTGRYKIIPAIDVSVPCVPFTLATSVKTVTNRSGDSTRGTDGEVTTFTVEQGTGVECCTVKSKLEIKLPDCVKGYDWSDGHTYDQIKYCDRGTQKSAQLITMVQDATNCSLYPKVGQIVLPCCSLADESSSGSFTINGRSVSYTLTRTDCSYALSIGNVTIPVGITCAPTINTTAVDVKVKYKSSDEDEASEHTKQGIVQFSADYENGCPLYTLTLGTIDLSDLDTDASITNGGDVFQKKSGDNEGKLYIDGRLSGNDIWYGGGYGDLATDAPVQTFCRGPRMGATSPYGAYTIPAAAISTAIITDSSGSNTMWRSTRPDSTDIDGAGVESSLTNAATGDLSMVMPTGLQWHSRGIAMTLSHFMFSDCGVLSYMNETGVAALVSPAPSVLTSDNTKNASGLAIYPTDNVTTPGLAVKASDGLRIYGISDGKTPSSDTDDATDRQGALEIQYGAGIRVIGNSSASGDSKYRSHPSTANGAIEINYGPGMNAVKTADSNGNITAFYDGAAALDGAIVPNAGRGLRLHGRTKMGSDTTSASYKDQIEVYKLDTHLGFNSDNKLVIYDKASSAEKYIDGSSYGSDTFARNADCTMSTVVCGGYASNMWSSTTIGKAPNQTYLSALINGTNLSNSILNTGNTLTNEETVNALLDLRTSISRLITFVSELRITQMHIATSGVIMAINAADTSSGVTRNAV